MRVCISRDSEQEEDERKRIRTITKGILVTSDVCDSHMCFRTDISRRKC